MLSNGGHVLCCMRHPTVMCSSVARRSLSLSGIDTVQLVYNHYPSTSESRQSPLVIVHGLFGQRQNWSSIGKALPRRLGADVYTVDLRNHGSSPWHPESDYPHFAADLHAFLVETSNPKSPTGKSNILGHSLGGKAVTLLALHKPSSGLIDRLIIEDVSPKRYEKIDMAHSHIPKFTQKMLDIRLDINEFDALGAAREFAKKEMASTVPDPRVLDFLLSNLARRDDEVIDWKMNLEALSRNLEAIFGFPELPPNSVCHRPALVVNGSQSDYVKKSDHAMFSRLYPQCQFVTIPGAGHWVHADKPTLFMDAITRFLTSKSM